MGCEHQDIALPFTKWRQQYFDNAQSVVEVLTESPIDDHFLERPMGSGDHARIGPLGDIRANCLKFTILKDTQQFALEIDVCVPDFVEEDCATLSLCEAASPISNSAGECSTNMAEEL